MINANIKDMASGKDSIGADSTAYCFVLYAASARVIIKSVQLFQEKSSFIFINQNLNPLDICRLVFDQ